MAPWSLLRNSCLSVKQHFIIYHIKCSSDSFVCICSLLTEVSHFERGNIKSYWCGSETPEAPMALIYKIYTMYKWEVHTLIRFSYLSSFSLFDWYSSERLWITFNRMEFNFVNIVVILVLKSTSAMF